MTDGEYGTFNIIDIDRGLTDQGFTGFQGYTGLQDSLDSNVLQDIQVSDSQVNKDTWFSRYTGYTGFRFTGQQGYTGTKDTQDSRYTGYTGFKLYRIPRVYRIYRIPRILGFHDSQDSNFKVSVRYTGFQDSTGFLRILSFQGQIYDGSVDLSANVLKLRFKCE